MGIKPIFNIGDKVVVSQISWIQNFILKKELDEEDIQKIIDSFSLIVIGVRHHIIKVDSYTYDKKAEVFEYMVEPFVANIISQEYYKTWYLEDKLTIEHEKIGEVYNYFLEKYEAVNNYWNKDLKIEKENKEESDILELEL